MELESQLQSLGYEVTSIVDTGKKAIEKAETDKPDLMLMDIRIKGESFEDVYSFKINTGSGKVKWVEIKQVITNWDNKPATLNSSEFRV